MGATKTRVAASANATHHTIVAPQGRGRRCAEEEAQPARAAAPARGEGDGQVPPQRLGDHEALRPHRRQGARGPARGLRRLVRPLLARVHGHARLRVPRRRPVRGRLLRDAAAGAAAARARRGDLGLPGQELQGRALLQRQARRAVRPRARAGVRTSERLRRRKPRAPQERPALDGRRRRRRLREPAALPEALPRRAEPPGRGARRAPPRGAGHAADRRARRRRRPAHRLPRLGRRRRGRRPGRDGGQVGLQVPPVPRLPARPHARRRDAAGRPQVRAQADLHGLLRRVRVALVSCVRTGVVPGSRCSSRRPSRSRTSTRGS